MISTSAVRETSAMNRIGAARLGGPMKNCLRLLVLVSYWLWGAGAAHACSCDPTSPEAGFDRAQYVFTGKVVQADQHEWLIEVDSVWKGHEKLGHTVKLKDAYAYTDCQFNDSVSGTALSGTA